MKTENYFEFENTDKRFSVKIVEIPSFHISSEDSSESVVEFQLWVKELLEIFGYTGEIENLNYEIFDDSDYMKITGSFGSLVIKNDGGLEYIKEE